MKLNDFCAHLVPLLGLTMGELTELTRAVREGTEEFTPRDQHKAFDRAILKGKAGPGGGVDMNPYRAAFLLLALSATALRREVGEKTWIAYHLDYHLETSGSDYAGWGADFKPTVKLCPLTRQTMLGEAIKVILADQDLAVRIVELRLHTEGAAEIVYDDGKVSMFGALGLKPASNRIKRITIIDGLVFHAVAQLLSR